MEIPTFNSLEGFLLYATGTGAAVIALLVSNLIRNAREGDTEYFKWLRTLDPLWVQLITVAASVVVPIVAFIILQQVPSEVLAQYDQWFLFVGNLFVAIGGQQLVYQFLKTRPAEPNEPAVAEVNPPRVGPQRWYNSKDAHPDSKPA